MSQENSDAELFAELLSNTAGMEKPAISRDRLFEKRYDLIQLKLLSRLAVLESALVIGEVLEKSPRRLGGTGRMIALGLAAGCLALLCTAAKLTPSPEGMATHTQLHLQHCGFLQSTGLPCPSCGMTTSFSWFARGNIVASTYVQPMGMMLALMAAVTVWIGGYVAITGKPVYRLVTELPAKYHVFPLMILALAAWAWKIFIHLHGIDGWR